MTYGAAARACLGAVAVTAAVAIAGCGSDAALKIDNNARCGGGSGPQVRGVVRMPNGRVAARLGLAERLAALAAAPAEALTGHVSPVGRGVTVELVELRSEDLGAGEPGSLGRTTTNGKGEFCIGLVRDTTVDVCRYMLRVGDRDAGTRTRAFVTSSDTPIDVDFVSEATVQVILSRIPPAGLCDFAPDEIAAIRDAVRDAPGTVTGANVAEVNALATTLASGDANVRAAVVAAAGNLPAPTATGNPSAPTATRDPSAPTATATSVRSATPVVPPATATRGGPTGSPTSRPTRTLNGPTATASPPRSVVPSRTNTPGVATATVPAATATVPAATPTVTRTAGGPTPTFTPTTIAAGLGDRVFTIREDSGAPAPDPRTGFFSSGLNGYSVSERFSSGPIVLTAEAPNASGVAQLRLKQDAYFKVFIKLGASILCVKWVAQGSRGSIDCNGGTAYGVTMTEPAGASPPGVPMTGVGGDSGPGAANLFVRQVIAEIENRCPTGGGTCTITGSRCTTNAECAPVTIDDSGACDATTVFDNAGLDVVYTTANFLGTKGTRTFNKNGESFSCEAWTMSDGPGMLVTSLLAVDERAGGSSANGIRVADR